MVLVIWDWWKVNKATLLAPVTVSRLCKCEILRGCKMSFVTIWSPDFRPWNCRSPIAQLVERSAFSNPKGIATEMSRVRAPVGEHFLFAPLLEIQCMCGCITHNIFQHCANPSYPVVTLAYIRRTPPTRFFLHIDNKKVSEATNHYWHYNDDKT